MKRLTSLLLLILLLTVAAPALAVPTPEELLAVQALHPELTAIATAGDEDDAFFLLKDGEGVKSLCILRRENGTWTEVLHSEKAICNPERRDLDSWYNYNSIELDWDGENLAIIYRYRKVIWWQHRFTRMENGEFRFDRLYYADEGNDIREELTYADGYVRQSFVRTWQDGSSKVIVYPPCPMPWLAGCETLAGFDASAFPMDLYSLSEEELTRVAAELLPGYTLWDGRYSSAPTFLMTNPSGECVFMGGVYQDGEWVWTESTPLPEGTGCDSYHAGSGAMSIYFPKPGAEPDEWGDIPCNEYAIYLQEDGRWLIGSVLDEEDAWFHFESAGLHHNWDGTCFGEYLGERDITKVDWQTVPHSFDEALVHMSRDWGVLGYDRIPLRSGPSEEMTALALCRYGAPVKVLGTQGDWANVALLGGETTGWLPADTLLLGPEQMITTGEYDDMWGVYTWRVSAAFNAPWVECYGGTQLLDAPEGRVVWQDVSGEQLQLVCEMDNGWYLVCWSDTMDGGYIRAEYTMPDNVISMAPNLAREYFPDCPLVMGEASGAAAELLLSKPGGAQVLVCGIYDNGEWVWTESSPLPAGTLLGQTEGGDPVLSILQEEGELCVLIHHERNAWRIYELQADGFNWMYTDGMLIAEDGTEAPGQPGFRTDIRHTDWEALPASLEEAVGMLK